MSMMLHGNCPSHLKDLAPARSHQRAWVLSIKKCPSPPSRCFAKAHTKTECTYGSTKSAPRTQRSRSRSRCLVAFATAEAAVRNNEVVAREEQLEDGVKRLFITVPAGTVLKAWQKAIRQEGRTHDFPGFRQGKKVPEALIVQRVGKETIAQRAISFLINDSLPAATEKHAPTAYEDSLVLDTPVDAAANFDKDSDFSYSCSLTLQPEVKWKGDYKKLKIESQAMPDEETIRDLAQEKVKVSMKDVGSLRIVQGRGLKLGDVAVIDIELRKKENDELIEGSQAKGKQIDTAQAQHTVELPGFVDDIQGMVVNDRRELSYTLPESWWDPKMKGTEVVCHVQLKELFMWELPKLTDQVAKALLPGSKDVEDFTQKVIAAERELVERMRVEELHNNVCKAVADLVDIEIPKFLYRAIGENEYQAELLMGQANGSLSREEVEELATEELLQKYMENRSDHLTDMVKVTVGMEAIWREQNLTIDETQARIELETAMQQAQESGEKLDEERLATQVHEAVKGTKIVEWLMEQGEVIEKPYTRSLEAA